MSRISAAPVHFRRIRFARNSKDRGKKKGGGPFFLHQDSTRTFPCVVMFGIILTFLSWILSGIIYHSTTIQTHSKVRKQSRSISTNQEEGLSMTHNNKYKKDVDVHARLRHMPLQILHENGEKSEFHMEKQHHEPNIRPVATWEEDELYNFVKTIRKPHFVPTFQMGDTIDHTTIMPYDVFHCPDDPPENYPMEWPLLDILSHWNPNRTDFSTASEEGQPWSTNFSFSRTDFQRPTIYQGLCIFTYKSDFHKAKNYRNKEMPFILRDDPAILQVVHRWNQPNYLETLFGEEQMETEYSTSKNLMYFQKQRLKHKNSLPEGWTPPMSIVKMTYSQWLTKAKQAPQDMSSNKPHWYFRVNAKDSKEEHSLFHELPFFSPNHVKQQNIHDFYLVDLQDTRGINCRFGMQGNTAITHFDASRNFIALFGGERRYILSHPQNCPYLGLYPAGHPSGRHSAIEWSNPNLKAYPEFSFAQGNEIVLQAGDVLYLPTYWFHYIVSLDLNWQCNARSGTTYEYKTIIEQCGFHTYTMLYIYPKYD